MIICICKNISDKQLRSCLGNRRALTQELLQELKLGQDCGQCLGEACRWLDSAKKEQTLPTNVDSKYEQLQYGNVTA